MGVVYEAIDLSNNQHVALKMIIESHLASFEARRRFLIESRAVATLKKYPNIVPLYEAGEYEDQPYLSMQFMEGGDLRKKIEFR